MIHESVGLREEEIVGCSRHQLVGVVVFVSSHIVYYM